MIVVNTLLLIVIFIAVVLGITAYKQAETFIYYSLYTKIGTYCVIIAAISTALLLLQVLGTK